MIWMRLRDAPLDIWGGLEFLLLANFFFTSARKQSFFFWQWTSDNFFLCFAEKRKYHFFVVCFPYYVFGVFSGQHNFHQFRQQTFFFCPHFQQTFFSDFGGDKLFISIFFEPPPPQISNGTSLNLLKMLSETTWGCKPQTLMTLYKAYIRPALEYSAI